VDNFIPYECLADGRVKTLAGMDDVVTMPRALVRSIEVELSIIISISVGTGAVRVCVVSPVGVADQYAVFSRGFFRQTAHVGRRVSPVARHSTAQSLAAAVRGGRARRLDALFGPYLGRSSRYLAPRVPHRGFSHATGRRRALVDHPFEPAPLGAIRRAAAGRR